MPAIDVVIVERNGDLSNHTIKKFKNADLYKKCNFRKSEGFEKRATWDRKVKGVKFIVDLYARDFGAAKQENKYDFPPPIDNELYFGNCVLVRRDSLDSTDAISLSVNEWETLYEALFGGFEDLSSTVDEDENESDELEDLPEEAKTEVGGYLKDGFVVDDDDVLEYDSNNSYNSEDDMSDSELSEEGYIFSDEG